MEVTAPEGQRKYARFVEAAAEAVVAFDFDGTLSPMVDDPDQAHIHEDASAALLDLAPHVKAFAIITGRPAAQAVSLGRLDELADALARIGRSLYVFGQYGNERWSSSHRVVDGPPPPPGLAAFTAALPAVLERAGAQDAYVEEKGIAVAVHTRRLPDPDAALARLTPELDALAAEHGLVPEPGKQVVEVRAEGMHKGLAVDTLIAETDAGAFAFFGDDLGDVDAFEAVARWGAEGHATLLVYSLAGEPNVLADLADVEVAGPDGVLDLLRQMAADAGRT